MAVWLKPCGMGSATTTTLPEAVAAMPSAYSWPATLSDWFIAALRRCQQTWLRAARAAGWQGLLSLVEPGQQAGHGWIHGGA